MTTSIEDRVKAGAAFLDKRRPGWANEIHLAFLDMQMRGCCILGQLFGDWKDGMELLAIEKGSEFGFNMVDPVDGVFVRARPDGSWITNQYVQSGYGRLNDLWTSEIMARQEEGADAS